MTGNVVQPPTGSMPIVFFIIKEKVSIHSKNSVLSQGMYYFNLRNARKYIKSEVVASSGVDCKEQQF